MTDAEASAEGRREAAPAALAVLVVFVALALVSRAREWELVGLPWWIWLAVAIPSLLLTIDLLLTFRGKGLVQSRRAALALLGLLVLGNLLALGVLVAGLVTTSAADLGGGELLLTGFAIWTADVIVFGLLFWELDVGGPAARIVRPRANDPRFPVPAGREPAARAGTAGVRWPGTTSTSR